MSFEEFIDLKKSNKIPGDSKIIKGSVVSQRCIRLSEVLKSETLDVGTIVVPDKLDWSCYSKSNGIYSSDGDYIYNYHSGMFVQYLVKDRLIPIKTHNFSNKIKKWRNSKMDLNSKLNGLYQDMEKENNAGTPVAPITTSTQFKGGEDANLDKLEAKAKTDALKNAITSIVSNVKLADTKHLKAYNFERSEVIGWITDKDTVVRSRVKTVVEKNPSTRKPVLVDNAPSSIHTDLAKGAPVDKKYFKTNSTLEIVQNAPGPARFCAVRMPVAGLFPLEDLRNPDAKFDVRPDTPTDFVVKLFAKKELCMTVVALIGDAVKESPETHADPSKLIVKLVGKPVTDKETFRTENRLTPVIAVESKRKLITSTNYFPRTTYKTISVDAIKTPEEQAKANLSLFGNLFRSVAGRDISYNKLDAAQKELVAKEGKVIKSKFFDPAVNHPLGIKGVFTGALVNNPQIVEKVEQPTKNGEGTTLKAISYNAATAEEDPYGISPFTDKRFANFLRACGDALTPQTLKELYKKSAKNSGGSSTKVELTSNESAKIFLADALDGGLSALKFDGLSEQEINKLDEDVLRIVNKFNAKAAR